MFCHVMLRYSPTNPVSSGYGRLSYALGSDQTRKLKDFMLDISDAVNKDMSLNLGAIPYLPDQAMHLEADIANLKQDTGWQPKTDFAAGIRALLMDIHVDRKIEGSY